MKSQWSNQRAFNKYLSARNDFKRGHYKLASRKLLSLDVVAKNDDVNHLLVRCLYRQKAYRDAEEILLSGVNSYTVNHSLIHLMINVLLKNHEYIICREVIVPFADSVLKQSLLSQIKDDESQFVNTDDKKIHRLAKQFYHLSDYSLIHQRDIFRRAQRLPLKMFISVAKHLLVDPFLAPVMRLSILDSIRKMNQKLTLKYRWIDRRVYTVNVNDLQDLTSTRSYRQIMKMINSKYNQNPLQTLALKRNLRLDLSYLYPFNNRMVTDSRLWVKIAALRLKGEQPIFNNAHVKFVYCLQVKLNEITKNLVK